MSYAKRAEHPYDVKTSHADTKERSDQRNNLRAIGPVYPVEVEYFPHRRAAEEFPEGKESASRRALSRHGQIAQSVIPPFIYCVGSKHHRHHGANY